MFDRVPGQNRIKKNLAHAMESGQISHAYLLIGYKGGCQEILAEDLAAALVCEAGVDRRPCGVCGPCRKFQSGNLLDYICVKAEEGTRNIKIKQVRDLITQMATRTHDGGLRICYIMGADQMTPEAQNALLKSLEEPAPGNVFLLTAENGEKILPTIRSRCQVLTLEQDDCIERDDAIEMDLMDVLKNLFANQPFGLFAFCEKYGKEKEKSRTGIDQLIQSTEKVLLAEKTGLTPDDPDDLTSLLLKNLKTGQAEPLLEILFEFSKRFQYNVNLRLQWENTFLKFYDIISA